MVFSRGTFGKEKRLIVNDRNKLELIPIGKIFLEGAGKNRSYEYPHQGYADSLSYRIELEPNRNFEQAVEDLNGFSHIWLIFWFSESKGWKPKSLPPRGPVRKRGVFATRSPYRPNPVGLTLVKLEKISGLKLYVKGGDFINGTPLLDIKPYIGKGDTAENFSTGWLEEVEKYRFEVVWEEDAARKARTIERKSGLALKKIAERILSYTREPHPYMRISKLGEKRVLALQNWRILFHCDEENEKVVIESVADDNI
jgi:tRNA-Thr(GGU) m(6)t(6)A37 methyltransferase TsaA